MAKLYFRYGAMGSSKSANALMTAHNFEEMGKTVLMLKSAIDTRWGVGEVSSRAGMKHSCMTIGPTETIANVLSEAKVLNRKDPDVVIVDEAQFLSKEQVKDLAILVDDMGIPVICYGLKNSAIDGKLFEGSEALLYYADSIEELKTLCSFCEKKAIMNLRIVNGKPIYEGDVVVLGDVKKDGEKENSEYYMPCCRHHYFHPEF